MLDPNITKLQQSYDQVPYLSQPYSQSHPDRLATLARLFNMNPAPIDSARVLELGCASGGNIIPMAYFHPDSQFVGVELTEGHAKAGQKTISDLGLKNIEIRHGNILDVDVSWGTFDYIICHGVFSWVPESVQEKILSISNENLVHQGVAYISYNTYPGWHMREMVRHMMLYHANQFTEPDKRLSQGKALIDFLAGAAAQNTNDPYALLLKNELECLKSSGDWYVFHDYMEVVNTPIYFHQFVERAGKHNLQYLAEAGFSIMFQNEFSQDVSDTLEDLSRDIVQKEQYMDFLRNRTFRQTLLCKKSIELKRTLDADSLSSLYILSSIKPESDPLDLSIGVQQKFKTLYGTTLETEDPIVKAGFKILGRHWPAAIDFHDLFEKCMAELRTQLTDEQLETQDWRKELGRGLLYSYVSDSVEFTSRPYQTLCPELSEFPKIIDLASYQIKKRQTVVNSRHEMVSTDSLAVHLIPILDGTKDREAILNHMINLVENRTITLNEYDVPVVDPDKIRQTLEKSIDTILRRLWESGLLEA